MEIEIARQISERSYFSSIRCQRSLRQENAFPCFTGCPVKPHVVRAQRPQAKLTRMVICARFDIADLLHPSDFLQNIKSDLIKECFGLFSCLALREVPDAIFAAPCCTSRFRRLLIERLSTLFLIVSTEATDFFLGVKAAYEGDI